MAADGGEVPDDPLSMLDKDALADHLVELFKTEMQGQRGLAGQILWGSVHEVVRLNLALFTRYAINGVRPSSTDLRPLARAARLRAAEGVSLEDVLRAYRLGGHLAWRAYRRAALEAGIDQDSLLAVAERLLTYLGSVTTEVTRAYLSEREALVSETERRMRSLLEAIDLPNEPDSQTATIAEEVGFPLVAAYVPFAVAVAGGTAVDHARYATALRATGCLALSEYDRVFGIAVEPDAVSTAALPDTAIVALGRPTPRGRLRRGCALLKLLVEAGVSAGRVGRVEMSDFAPEVLVAASPEVGQALVDRVLRDLPADFRATLLALKDCDFDRALAAQALHVHRNTVRYRLHRIEELSGLDLTSVRDQTLIYLACCRYQRPPEKPWREQQRPLLRLAHGAAASR